MDATTLTLPNDLETCQQLLQEKHQALQQTHEQVQEHREQLAQRDAQLQEQQATIRELHRQNTVLMQKQQLLLDRIYGQRAERIDADQLLLFGKRVAGQDAKSKQTDAEQEQPAKRRRRRGHGRRPIPKDLPRYRVEHPIEPEQRTCPCCGKPRKRIGQRIREMLDFNPASLFVIEHVQPKYACSDCEDGGVVTARRSGEGEPIERGLPGPGLIAQIITAKYGDHLPLYRQEHIFARHGAWIDRSTMCGWLRETGKLVQPLVKLMRSRILQSKVVASDDTPVPVQVPGNGKTKTGRLWVYLGDRQHPYTVYDYRPDRSRDGPKQWLEGFEGYLQADAYSGYDVVFETGKVIEVGCWAHARRKFYDARLTDPVRAHEALAMIRRMYEVESKADEREREASDADGETSGSNRSRTDPRQPDPAARRELRQAEAKPILDQFEPWLKQNQPDALPKSPIGEAIGYALSNWQALCRYVDDGDLAIDNNHSERAIRPLAIGRKNYLFIGADAAGPTAATLYSLVVSAQRHGLDPFAYLRHVLTHIAITPVTEIDKFLPDQIKREALTVAGTNH